MSGWLDPPSEAGIMWSASALLGLRCPLFVYWSLTPHAGQCVMPIACARASTCFLNCLCSLVLVLLTALPPLVFLLFVLGGGASQRQRDERLHRLTLPSLVLCSLFSLSSPFSFFSSLLCLWNGGCRVVRAQPCEHARNTAVAFVCSGLSTWVACVHFHVQCLLHTTTTVLLSPPHTVRY